jgi:hypothetical protein
VDDLLKRQMSLRGEPGVTREHGRRWYYQNWFVFMIVGTLAAVAAWAIIEPLFADLLYLQGPVEAINVEAVPSSDQAVTSKHERVTISGWVKIKGQKIWLLEETSLLKEDGHRERFDPVELKEGENVGVYADYLRGRQEDFAVAHYLTRDLVKQSAKKAAMTLSQLNTRAEIAHFLFFPLVAGLVGLCIGAVDGFICRLPKRGIISGLVGLIVGLIGGFISQLLAGFIYSPLNYLAMNQMNGGALSTMGFVIQMVGRSLAWGMAGLAMGLGQGIALRSKRLLIYGLLGGVVGGLLGGLLFDPIDMIGSHKPTAFLSRLIALAVVGASVGGLIGVVELLARDAWLRMTQGPLAGKEFLLFKDVMNIGSSPRSDIYLFNDPLVSENHATLRAVGDECEIETRRQDLNVVLNSRNVKRSRLRHGDQVIIGRTMFVFQKRKG